MPTNPTQGGSYVREGKKTTLTGRTLSRQEAAAQTDTETKPETKTSGKKGKA